MRILKCFFCISLVISLFNGKAQSEQLNCFHQQSRNRKIQSLAINLKSNLQDTVNSWIKAGDVRTLRLKEWIIDDMAFINPKKDKAILLLLRRGPLPSVDSLLDNRNDMDIFYYVSFDYIDVMYAFKRKNKWYYYYQKMPFMQIKRKRDQYNVPIPADFKDLALTGRSYMVHGYYKRGTCKYNKDFFGMWDIHDLKEQQK